VSTQDSAASISVTPNGPYIVTGTVPLSVETIGVNEKGESWEYLPGRTFEVRRVYALCRCGESANKPFCDGTHGTIAFDGTETASFEPFAEHAERVPGPSMELAEAPELCAFARFCDGSGSIWKLIGETDSEPVRELVKHQETHCPSGRLVVSENATGAAIEPAYDPAIVLLEDPQKECSGPIAVRGGIRLTSSQGTAYETRNRMTLCRCGKSANKPFCDGTHADVAFEDGLS
jgi:CDGSH-type Zn-finger protein